MSANPDFNLPASSRAVRRASYASDAPDAVDAVCIHRVPAYDKRSVLDYRWPDAVSQPDTRSRLERFFDRIFHRVEHWLIWNVIWRGVLSMLVWAFVYVLTLVAHHADMPLEIPGIPERTSTFGKLFDPFSLACYVTGTILAVFWLSILARKTERRYVIDTIRWFADDSTGVLYGFASITFIWAVFDQKQAALLVLPASFWLILFIIKWCLQRGRPTR